MTDESKPVEARGPEGADGGESGAAARPPRTRKLLLALVLFLTCAAYIGTLRFEFVYDDQGQIDENPAVPSWQLIQGYLTGHVWTNLNPRAEVGNYDRPVFMLWLLVNYQLFGLNPLGWRLTTLALHLV